MPNARPQCWCQAPQPRSGAPKAQGLIAALRPQHNPPCHRSLRADVLTANNTSTGADRFVAPQLQFRISTSLTDVTGGDRINAVLAAAGYNFSLLLRWLERLLRALLRMLLAAPAPAPNA